MPQAEGSKQPFKCARGETLIEKLLSKALNPNFSRYNRPISLLSSLGKVFEKLLLKRMVKFCKKKENILTHIQYGFREKRACMDAINSVTEFMRKEIEAKNEGQACFIDLQKTFDTLDHEILIVKLEKYGFRETILEIL